MLMDRALGFQVDITTRLLHNISLFDRQISTSSQDGDDDFDKWSFWAMLPVRKSWKEASEVTLGWLLYCYLCQPRTRMYEQELCDWCWYPLIYNMYVTKKV